MRSTLLPIIWLASLAAAQDQSSSTLEIVTLTGSQRRLTEDPTVSVTDIEASTYVTSTYSGLVETTGAPNATASSVTSTKEPVIEIGGSRTPTISGNMTASATSGSPMPSNTQACNNYPEFCTRKYSNITEICAHNSPFSRKNNFGSNQGLGVTQQLNDGVRMLQGQTHWVNGTLHYCHTTCDLLNAGTVEDYLREVTEWVSAHPFDVVTIIFGNGDYEKKGSDGKPLVTSQNFVDPIEKSGLRPFIYQPPKTAMTVEDWPTLSEMILSGKRVVTFIDYNFDTKAVPYMLWQFHNIWETPYSPTDINFPCTLGRPDGLKMQKQKEMMYIANHNLNLEIAIAGLSMLIPNTVELNVTNGVNGTGSLGQMAKQCTGKNFLDILETWSSQLTYM